MSQLRRYTNRAANNSRRILRESLRKKRKSLRDSVDPFSISEERFIELFRLTKEVCKNVFEEIRPHMPQRQSNGLSKMLRFLTALRFFAQGSYQRSVGQDFLLNVSQSSVSRCVREISNIMDKYLLAKYVKFPVSAKDMLAVKEKFYREFRFPGVIGAIDGSHIKLKCPDKDIEHVYVCRKGGHSINVQVVCDYNLKILDCNARFGGTAHDASVWRASALKVLLDNKYSSGERNFWLLGDSGYPQIPFLMTPIQGSNLTQSQESYNRQHRKARNCVERCFGVLKSRFRCLSAERVLMYAPIVARKIINSCIILHNIILTHNIGDGLENVEIDIEPMNANEAHYETSEVGIFPGGVTARQNVVANFFQT